MASVSMQYIFKTLTHFDIFGYLVKKLSLSILKDGLATRLLKETFNAKDLPKIGSVGLVETHKFFSP